MIDLVKTAQLSDMSAKYMLFDSWFSSPKTITALKTDCGLDTSQWLRKAAKSNTVIRMADTTSKKSTDVSLSEEEIIRIYGKRWDIEVFFKTCKSYLHLIKECRSLSYDALTAHVSIVFA